MDDITTNSEIPTLGQVAFNAYRAEVVTAFNGDPIPAWDDLDNGAPARRGWEAAAQAVREHMRMIDALDRTAHLAARQGLGRVHPAPSRWVPLGPRVHMANLGEPEPEFSAPIGHGEPPTGEHVPVGAEPDTDTPLQCKCLDGCCSHRG